MRVLILLYSLQPDIFLIPQHNIQNLIVRRLHPVAPHAAEAADGLLHVALHQALSLIHISSAMAMTILCFIPPEN